MTGAQPGEAEMVVEAEGAPVGGSHMEVHAMRSAVPQGCELQFDQPTADSAALDPRQQVNVQ